MNKKTIVICGIILLLVIILAVLFNSNNNNVLRKDGVAYALTVDGESQNNFPDKGMYKVATTCTNAKCKWDYDAWKLYVEDVTGNVSCHLEFTSIFKTNISNYIIGLSGTTQGEGQVVKEKGYRYEGQNPNNYVLFNNELWRIIGVIDSNSHGIPNTNLVKIIKNESIGGLVWNISLNNSSWHSSTLYELLNGYYFFSYNFTGLSGCNGYGYNKNAKCDYSLNGIKNTYRKMIKEVTWLAGYNSNFPDTVNSIYDYERSPLAYSGIVPGYIGYIGLMYASDYGFAASSSTCSRTSSDYSVNCSSNNWLYNGEMEWTITSLDSSTSSYGGVSFVNNRGILDFTTPPHGFVVRPTLYLNENVYVIDGTGSESDPYIIGMD